MSPRRRQQRRRRVLGEHFRPDGKPKQVYESREEAMRAALTGQWAYRCSFCDAWHLGGGKRSKGE